jgi:hypothetical protein
MLWTEKTGWGAFMRAIVSKRKRLDGFSEPVSQLLAK